MELAAAGQGWVSVRVWSLRLQVAIYILDAHNSLVALTLLQVIVFIFMDAMTAPAPKLRIIFAVVLVARFVESFGKRMLYIYPPEQLGLVPHVEGYLRGLGTSSRQSFVRSIDWTVLAMLGSSIISVLLYPRELAVVRSHAPPPGWYHPCRFAISRVLVCARPLTLPDSTSLLTCSN